MHHCDYQLFLFAKYGHTDRVLMNMRFGWHFLARSDAETWKHSPGNSMSDTWHGRSKRCTGGRWALNAPSTMEALWEVMAWKVKKELSLQWLFVSQPPWRSYYLKQNWANHINSTQIILTQKVIIFCHSNKSACLAHILHLGRVYQGA